MSWRTAVAAALLSATLALGGCAHDLVGDARNAAPFPGDATTAATAVGMQPAAPAVASWSRVEVAVPESHAGLPLADQEAFTAVSNPNRPYLLDSGDKLRVFVYGQPNLSRIYPVDQSGRLSVPLIGTVSARGRTASQVAAAIRGQLGTQFVRDPQVTVDIHQHRPFFILGEVRNPGQYDYVNGMTVETAVAIAGGYSERASERRVRLKRRSGGALETIEAGANFEVEPGDSIYVYERYF